MNKNSRIYVAGHRGLVGSAIVRKLRDRSFTQIIQKSSRELDLRIQDDVNEFFKAEKPEFVFLAAARVGGILANLEHQAEFLHDNLMITAHVIHASYVHGVKKLLNLGSSCIYPREAPQPLKENYLLTGKLESTNEGYALAKITGIKLCRYFNQQYGTNFISVMPTNLYGPHDNFDLASSHVLPALIKKIHEAKHRKKAEVVLWGDGTPMREFLHVDDLAEAVMFLMENYDAHDIGELVNIGTGKDISINSLAGLVCDIIGYDGEIKWDTSMPSGTPRKLLDVSKMTSLGWTYQTELREGIISTYRWFINSAPSGDA